MNGESTARAEAPDGWAWADPPLLGVAELRDLHHGDGWRVSIVQSGALMGRQNAAVPTRVPRRVALVLFAEYDRLERSGEVP